MTAFLRPACVLVVASVLMIVGPSAAEAALDETFSEITAHMHEHLAQVGAIKSAVIAGKLEDLREPANWLATHEEPAWLPPVEEMRLYAARAAAATDLTEAAAAAGEIARSCGNCHRDSGVEVAVDYAEPPSAGEQSLTAQMQRHLWAADRMWAGLIGPSDAAWKQGASILADVEFDASDIAAEPDQQAAVSDLLRRVRLVGTQAGLAESIELRSSLYGEFLSLCASCHQLTGGGPAQQRVTKE